MFITSIHLLIRRYAAFTIVFRSANVLEADCLQLDVVNGQVQIWPKFGGNEKYLLGKMVSNNEKQFNLTFSVPCRKITR